MKQGFKLAAIAAGLALAATTAKAQTFPLAIEHKFGTTIIEAAPERVATVDYAGADNLLALGIQPVIIRHWHGDYPRSVGPWADSLLGETPEILRGDLNFEQIAATDPDVIIALWSGITERDYELLSRIAPVVAVPEGVGDYTLPWDERAILSGRATGREEQARAQVRAIRDTLAAIAANHPEWNGKEASVAYVWNGNPGAYASSDVRAQVLNQMGFVTPAAIDALAGDSFDVELSQEDLSPIDGDLLIWIGLDSGFEPVESLVARPFMDAHKQGREIFLDPVVTSALSHASLLSLSFAIERLVPLIEAAADGDPATEVPLD